MGGQTALKGLGDLQRKDSAQQSEIITWNNHVFGAVKALKASFRQFDKLRNTIKRKAAKLELITGLFEAEAAGLVTLGLPNFLKLAAKESTVAETVILPNSIKHLSDIDKMATIEMKQIFNETQQLRAILTTIAEPMKIIGVDSL